MLTPVQGPRAGALKYAPSLCGACNGATTQPFDIAYDGCISWVFTNEGDVLRRRIIDLAAVYGDGWQDKQRDLYKYFVKGFGCKLVNDGIAVPQDLVDLLPLDCFRTGLRLTFAVNEDTLEFFPGAQGRGFIGKGGLHGFAPSASPHVYTGFEWSEHVSWLTVLYWYAREPEGGMGSIWTANTQHLYLGSLAPLSPAAREEARRKGPMPDRN